MIIRKSPAELEVMARAGAVVAGLHDVLREAVRPGVSTADLDRIAEREVRSRGAVPSFKGYHGFPATLCTSVNAEIVHGIPSPRVVLRPGDVLKIDAGAIVDGYHADAAVTWIVGADEDPGVVPPEVVRLVADTRAALWDAMAAALAGGRLGDVSAAVGNRGERGGYGVVRGFVGHGVGRALHEDPEVANTGRPGRGLRLQPGLVIAIEPMFTLGTSQATILPDGWTVVTADGSVAAHWEHTVAVTEDGPRVLTARADEPSFAAADVAGGADGAARPASAPGTPSLRSLHPDGPRTATPDRSAAEPDGPRTATPTAARRAGDPAGRQGAAPQGDRGPIES